MEGLLLLRPYFSSHSMCTTKILGHSRVSKSQDNGTAEVSAREKKITAQLGKCLKNSEQQGKQSRIMAQQGTE